MPGLRVFVIGNVLIVASMIGEASTPDLGQVVETAPRVELKGVEDPQGWVGFDSKADGPTQLARTLAGPRGWVRGRVVGADSGRIEVWVNGFPEAIAAHDTELRQSDAASLDFRASVRFGLQRNELLVRFRRTPRHVRSESKCIVETRVPDTTPRLHLWIIGMGGTDERKLLARAVASLRGEVIAQDRISTPAFQEGVVYGPDCGQVRRMRILGRLEEIAANVALSPRPTQDVVVIYYEGNAPINPDQPAWRLRAESPGAPDDVFPLREIQRFWPPLRIGRVYMIDASRAPVDEPLFLSESASWVQTDAPLRLLRLSQSSPRGPAAPFLLRDAMQDAASSGNSPLRNGTQITSRFHMSSGTVPRIVPFGKNVEDDLHILLEARRILPAGLVDLAEKPYFHLQSRVVVSALAM